MTVRMNWKILLIATTAMLGLLWMATNVRKAIATQERDASKGAFEMIEEIKKQLESLKSNIDEVRELAKKQAFTSTNHEERLKSLSSTVSNLDNNVKPSFDKRITDLSNVVAQNTTKLDKFEQTFEINNDEVKLTFPGLKQKMRYYHFQLDGNLVSYQEIPGEKPKPLGALKQ